MSLKIFTVYDCKAEAYMQPFFMQNKGQAIRAWTDTVNDPKTQFFRHPADFTLFEIGTYNEQNGQIESYTVKIPLGTALEFKQSMPEQWTQTLREDAVNS